MYVNQDTKAVFLAHPRTASRATVKVLEEYGFKKGVAPPFETAHGGHHARIAEPPPDDWKVACTVRHHFDVVVSWLFNTTWRRVGQGRTTLEEATKDFDMAHYLETYMHRTRPEYPDKNELLPHTKYSTFIISYSYLEKDLTDWIFECTGELPTKLDIPIIGNAPRRGIKCDDVLTDEMKAAIVDRYGAEMKQWGFLVNGKAVGYQ